MTGHRGEGARAMLSAPTWQALDHPVIQADCIEALRALPDCSIDAVVTDPPYGLEFMGQEWDRPWRMGKVSSPGAADGTPFRRHVGTPSFAGSGNPRFRNCGGTKYDRTRPTGCSRDAADFPAEAATQMRAFQAWCEAWAAEAWRVLKPGGYLLAFGGTRTYHRLAAGIEDAGFEVRDTLAWMFGSGFPKSLDVSKAIDRAAGVDREVLSTRVEHDITRPPGGGDERLMASAGAREERMVEITAPATPDAAQWEGWGTALKPAFEPIVVARKPLAGTVAANVLEHGTGAINIDACRIPGPPSDGGERRATALGLINDDGWEPQEQAIDRSMAAGRWPANVVLDEEAGALLDEQTGTLTSGRAAADGHRRNADKFPSAYGEFVGRAVEGDVLYGDEGGASRFFYCAKAARGEREAGLDGFEVASSRKLQGGALRSMVGHPNDRGQASTSLDRSARNHHPTVKPIALMRWLLRLIASQPDAVVLDLFAGSGTTVCAGMLAESDVGRITVVGIEREPRYVAIARARAAWWAGHTDGVEMADRLAAERERRRAADDGQLDILSALDAAA